MSAQSTLTLKIEKNKSMVFAFTRSARPETLAQVTEDGRLQLWDTQTSAIRHQLARPDHLTVKLTCLAWPSGYSPKMLAAGCDTGLLLLWDVECAALVHELHGHSQRANHVLFNASGSVLFSCADDCQVCCWDVASGEQLQSFKVGNVAIKRLALSNDEQFLLLGASSLRLVCRKGWKRVQRLPGHSKPVSFLCFSPDDTLALSSAADRHLSLWRLNYGTKCVADHPCLATLSLEHPVHQLGFLTQVVGASLLNIVVLSADGTLQLHGIETVAARIKNEKKKQSQQLDRLNTRTVLSQKPLLIVRVAPLATEHSCIDPQRIFQVATYGIDGELLVAYGSSAGPCFATVSIKQGDATGNLSLPRVMMGLLDNETASSSSKKKGHEPKNVVQLLGAVDMPLKRQRSTSATAASATTVSNAANPLAHEAAVEQGTIRPLALPPAAADALTKAAAEAAAADAANAATISEADYQHTFGRQLVALEHAANSGLAPPGISMKPSTASQAAIVIQALQNGDMALLEQALQVHDAQVVASTVARLPVVSVLPFLEAVLQRIQGKPSRVVTLASWLRALLSTHAAYLMSCPQLLPMLTPIYQLIDERISIFKPLLKLVGRMQMLQSQIASQAAAAGVNGEVATADPLVMYDEAREEKAYELQFRGDEKSECEGEDDDNDDDFYGSDEDDDVDL